MRLSQINDGFQGRLTLKEDDVKQVVALDDLLESVFEQPGGVLQLETGVARLGQSEQSVIQNVLKQGVT